MISCVRACVCVYLQYDTMYQLQTESQELRNNIEQFSHSATKEDASALRRAVNSLLKQNDEASEEAQPGGNSGSVYMTRSSSTRTRAKTMSRQEAIERVNASNDTGRASRSRDSTDSTQATMTSKQPAAREIGQSATAPLRVSSVLSWSANMGGGSPRGSTGTTNIQHYHAAATVRLEVGMISDSSMVFLDSVFFAVSALSFSHCLLVCLSAVPGLETGELVRKVNNLELELSSMTGKLDALISKARALARRNVLCTPPNCKLPPHPNTMKGIDWASGRHNLSVLLTFRSQAAPRRRKQQHWTSCLRRLTASLRASSREHKMARACRLRGCAARRAVSPPGRLSSSSASCGTSCAAGVLVSPPSSRSRSRSRIFRCARRRISTATHAHRSDACRQTSRWPG